MYTYANKYHKELKAYSVEGAEAKENNKEEPIPHLQHSRTLGRSGTMADRSPTAKSFG